MKLGSKLSEVERYLKRVLKKKIKISSSLIIAYLMTGMFSVEVYGSIVWIENDKVNSGVGGDNKSTAVWNDSRPFEGNNKEIILLADPTNKTGANTGLMNRDFDRTVVIGSRAVGGGNDATAIGYRAIVGKNDSKVTNTTSHQGTAVGYRAFSYGTESLSLGNDTVAYGESSISIGSDNVGAGMTDYSKKGLSYDIWKLYRQNSEKFNYTGEYAAVDSRDKSLERSKYEEYLNTQDQNRPFYKTHNWAFGDSSIAIGSRNVAYGHGSLAMGTLSIAKGNYSTALGTGTLAFGNSSVALGNEVYIYADQSVGVGNNIQAISQGSMVYGFNSYAGGNGSVAIGTRAMANVNIDGKHNNIINGSPEPVILDDLYLGASNDNNIATYNKLSELDRNKENLYKVVSDKQDGTGEFKARPKNTGAVAIGYYVIASGENSLALGRQAYSQGNKSTAIGPYAYSKGVESFALGYGSKSIGDKSFAIGAYSRSEGSNSLAIGIGSKVLNDSSNNQFNGENSLALGNSTEVTMQNSVALGYNSNTRYYYTGTDVNPKLSNNSAGSKNAITLPPYIPKGSSYVYNSTTEDGVVSVGGWSKRNGSIGLRRLIYVAPGVLDSDAATIGQLKALAYVNKEGVVTYYTKSGNNIFKVVKDDKGKFYKVNTDNGTPLDNNEINKNDVMVGPKGTGEKITEIAGKRNADMGSKLKFGHIADGSISTNSDHAITGNQLNQLGSTILGLGVQTNDKTKFDTPSFTRVQYEGSTGNQNHTTFKKAIDESITAINKGLVIQGDDGNGKISLGSTLKIKAGNTTVTGQGTRTVYKSDNIRTAYLPNKKELLIGIKESPEFKSVTVSEQVTNQSSDKTLTTKKYVDDKLKDAGKSHYLSVKGTDSDKGNSSNYDNDGAKGTHSVAIGVKASSTENAGIAIGYNAQSKAQNAVVIGKNVSIDVPNSFVLGSDNKVTQTGPQDRTERAAVVVIGSGTTLTESKSAIAIGAVNADGGTEIEYAAWTAAVGNKIKVKNGTDIVALGNNIKIESDTANRKDNTEVIAIGNGSNAKKASGSILIGAKTKAESNATKAVIIGYEAKAEANAAGAVAIGNGATVKTAAGDSIALGKESEAIKKENAESNYTATNNIKFIDFSGHGTNKSVLSIGKASKERIIKHVAPGKIGSDSTDAINGSQLYSAIDVFGHLGATVLGAEVDANKGFKESKFKQLIGESITASTPEKNMSFRQAINANIDKINKGFVFGAGDGANEYGTHYLGDKLIIKAGAIDKPMTTTSSEDGYSPDNIKTHYEKTDKNILIGIKDKPTFKNVIIENGIPDDTSTGTKKDTYDNYAVNKKYLDKRLEKVAANFTVKGDSNGTDGKGYTLDKDNNELTIAGDSKNIETEVDKSSKKVSVKLKDALTGITSIANDDTKIELKNKDDGKSIIFKTGNSGNDVTLSDGNFSGVSEIGKDDQAKITFKNNNSNEIDLKAGSTNYKFTESGLDLASKPITNLASGLTQNGSGTNVRQGLDDLLKLVETNGQPSGSSNSDELNKAINAGDLLYVANELKNKGLKFQGDEGGAITRKLGDTLKIVGEKAATDPSNSSTTVATAPDNITVVAKKSKTVDSKPNDTLEIRLAKDLKGIASIENEKDKSKIELKNDEIYLTTNNDKTVKVKDNALEGVNKISAVGDTNANSIDLAKYSNGTKNIEITSGGKTLTIAKDVTAGKEGISLTGLADRNVDTTDYGKNGSAGRAATESAVLDLKTKGLTFSANAKANNKDLQIGLGQTLKILGKDGDEANFDTNYSLNNIATKVDENNKQIRIGILKTPTFDSLTLGENNKISITPDNNSISLKLVGSNDAKVKLKNIADGTIGSNSTDAITGDQLHDLGVTHLGLSLNNTNNKFSAPSFTKLKDINGAEVSTSTTTYLGAINKNTAKINEGLKFAVATSTQPSTTSSADITRQLGATLKFAGDNKYITPSIDGTDTIKYTLSVAESLQDSTSDQSGGTTAKLVTDSAVKNYITEKFGSYSTKLNLEADNSDSAKKENVGSVDLKTKSLVIKGDSNITTSATKDSNEVYIKLKNSLTGINSIGNNDKSKISFDGANKNITFTVGEDTDKATYKFESSGLDLGNKQIKNVASAISSPQSKVNNVLSGTDINDIKGNVVNVQDLSDIAKAIINNGFKIKGNESNNDEQTLKLGSLLNIVSSTANIPSGNNAQTTKDDITAKIEKKDSSKDDLTLTLTLNKADSVNKNDQRAVTSKAVADELAKYTTTDTLGTEFLKVTGENIGENEDDKKTGRVKFGGNVGISKINLSDTDKSTTELVQAKAVIDYLKGTGAKSVKISDNKDTDASGSGSIAIGDSTIAENDGSIAIGESTKAKSSGSVSIGKESNVTGQDAIALGRKNTVAGQSSIAIGETNKILETQSYVLGTDNTVEAKNNIVLGSRNTVSTANNILLGNDITIDDSNVTNAIVLGDRSTGESNTVSVGNNIIKRRIINVDNPTGEYDATNKKYVDGLELSYISNYSENNKVKNKVKLTDGLNFKNDDNSNITVTAEANGGIKHSLANNLKQIDSIKSGTDAKGSKISFDSSGANKDVKDKIVLTIGTNSGQQATAFSFSETGLDLGDKKISNLADGQIATSSKEAITGAQLYDLASKLGITVETDDTKFKAPEFNNLALTKVNGTKDTDPTSVFDSLTKIVTKVNEGIGYKADIKSGDTANGYTTQYLGSTLDFVKATEEIKLSDAGAEQSYVGSNLITKYTNTGGNGKIQIGLKEKPDFKQISIKDNNNTFAQLGGDATNGGSLILNDKDGRTESISIKATATPTIEFKKTGADNKQGTGSITGLADLNDKSDLTRAVNQKYVDDLLGKSDAKVEDIDANRPFVFMLDNDIVVKGRDGKLYKKSDLKDAVYNEQEKKYTKGTDSVVSLTDEQVKEVYIAARSQDAENKPLSLGNIASALDPSEISSAITEESAKKLILGDTNPQSIGLNNLTEANTLLKVATLRDLQALSVAGFTFNGNDNNSSIHKKLGETLAIKGESSTTTPAVTNANSFKSAADNIKVEVDNNKDLVIKLAKELKNLESIVFEGKNTYGNSRDVKVVTKLNSDGMELKEIDTTNSDAKVKTTNYGIGKATFKEAKENDSEKLETITDHKGTLVKDIKNKKQSTYFADGTTINEIDENGSPKSDGKSAEYKLDSMTLTNNKEKTTISPKSIKIENADDSTKGSVELKVENGSGSLTIKDKDDKSITITGTKIKGLADIDVNEQDGTIAVNKNYVDNRIKDLVAGQPFEYKTKDGNSKVVRGVDGKLYKDEELNKYYYDKNTSSYKPKDDKSTEQLKEVENSDVIVNLMPEGPDKSPIALGNIESIMGTDISKAKENVKKLIDDTDQLFTKNKNKVATATDILTLAKAGIDFAGNTKAGEDIHTNLGDKIIIKGDDTDNKPNFDSAKGNIQVEADNDNKSMVIKLSSKLENMKSFNTEEIDATKSINSKTKVDKDGVSIEDVDKNTNKSTSTEIVLGTTENGKTTPKITITSKPTTGPSIDFAKNNDSGTGKITGLADIQDSDNGDVAVNKKYVDNKLDKTTKYIESVDKSNPFELVYNNKPIVMVDDKYYYADNVDKGVLKDGATALNNDEINKIEINQKDRPRIIKNVASGLELKETDNSKDKITDLLDKKGNPELNNVATIKDLQALADAGLYFYGNDNEQVHKQLSKELLIKGDGVEEAHSKSFKSAKGNINIRRVQKQERDTGETQYNLQVELNKKQTNMTSFETDDIDTQNNINNKVTLDAKKLDFKDASGKEAHYTIDEIVFNKATGQIKGLKDLNDNDPEHYAVNKGYVDKKMAQAKQGIDKAMSGVANAVAMANLVQTDSNSGYRHQIGAGYGTYENEHAIALGMSGVSENGKVVYKVSGSVNNRGNVAAGIGLGYQFGKKNEFSNENTKKLAELTKENEANKKKNLENEAKIDKLEKLVNTLMTNKSETKLYTINQFEFGKSTLTKAQIIKLKAIVKEINEKYSDRTIDITGFSDIVGQESFNLDLGLNRANKVSDLMIEFGLKNPQNIRKVSSYGYNNSVSKTNNQNRRVEIEIK